MKQLAVLSIAMLIVATAGCSRSYQFVGIVVDGQGVGVDQAQIVFCPYDEKESNSTTGQLTNSDGTFEVGWCCTPSIQFFRMTVSKAGYDDDKRIVSADEKNIRVVLSRSSKPTE